MWSVNARQLAQSSFNLIIADRVVGIFGSPFFFLTGDDPHAFSAVDVEEVLKANKEKAAAEKKSKDGDVEQTLLANMRFIHCNLYAAGLPPLSEEVLRKLEYFGMYGKINKIVMNCNTTGEAAIVDPIGRPADL